TFAVGSDNHLHVKYWNWVKPLALWADLGTPSGTLVVTGPGATTYHQGGRTDKQRIYAFVVGADHHLHVNYWTGTQWQWADLGTPPGTTVAQGLAISKVPPAAITFYRARKQRIYVFVVGGNGHLYVKYWNGAKWTWADQGAPSGTTVEASPAPAVITYVEGG